ncbi:MAG: hypothetical protein WDN27_01310 [Candidatus Saccharibacteria bacterium]
MGDELPHLSDAQVLDMLLKVVPSSVESAPKTSCASSNWPKTAIMS